MPSPAPGLRDVAIIAETLGSCWKTTVRVRMERAVGKGLANGSYRAVLLPLQSDTLREHSARSDRSGASSERVRWPRHTARRTGSVSLSWAASHIGDASRANGHGSGKVKETAKHAAPQRRDISGLKPRDLR